MNLFELFAKISLDTSDYEGALNDASEKTSSFGEKLKSGIATAGKVAAAGVAAASAAVTKITQSSLDSYADYEQLIGGVETLFGDAAKTINRYADAAYETAGLSMNQYMETITSFSASLLQGLGGDTAAAAEIANQAIVDMSDNANKMGTDMTLIQNAYQGFAKQNYTMLDNLKLGYGGTQAEMARLINDSGVLGDTIQVTAETVNDVSFDKIIEAIHVVQTEMGITGTTAKEASTTIQGSIASMKGAWANLLTAIAAEGWDIGIYVDNFVTSVQTVAKNVIPRVQQILSGIGELITAIVPMIAEQLPVLVEQVLPSLLTAGTSLLQGILQGILVALPVIADSAVDIVTTLTQFIIEQAPLLIETAGEIITTIVEGLIEAAPSILDAGLELMNQLTTGIENGLPDMVSRLPQIIEGILNFFTEHLPDILQKGVEIIVSLINGIINSIPALLEALPQIITAIVDFVTTNLPKIVMAGGEILGNLIVGIIQNIPKLVAALPQIISAIVNGIIGLLGSIVDVGKAIVEGIWQGITNAAGWLTSKITGWFNGVVDGVKSFLGIASPSKVFAGIGKNMALGLGEGWDDEYGQIKRDIEDGMDFGTAKVDFASSGIGRMASSVGSNVASAIGSAAENINIVVQSVLDGKVIGETAYQYSRNKARAYGV